MIVNCEFFVITLYEFHLEATGIQISILYFKCNHFKAHEAFPMMATELNARFGRALSEEEIEERINETISKKSLSKASWAVKIFKNWLSHRQSQGIINGLHVFKPLEEMSAGELDSQLRYFVITEAVRCKITKSSMTKISVKRQLYSMETTQQIDLHMSQKAGCNI